MRLFFAALNRKLSFVAKTCLAHSRYRRFPPQFYSAQKRDTREKEKETERERERKRERKRETDRQRRASGRERGRGGRVSFSLLQPSFRAILHPAASAEKETPPDAKPSRFAQFCTSQGQKVAKAHPVKQAAQCRSLGPSRSRTAGSNPFQCPDAGT